jgi:hypothetical protein
MKIKNTGTEPDRLASGSTPVAGRFEIHEMSMDKGVMKMRPLPSGLENKAGRNGRAQAWLISHHDDGPEATDPTGKAVQGIVELRKGRRGRCGFHGRGDGRDGRWYLPWDGPSLKHLVASDQGCGRGTAVLPLVFG